MEPAESDIMERKPRPVKENVLNWLSGMIVILQGFSMSMIAFGVFILSEKQPWGAPSDLARQTLTFTTLVAMHLFQSFLSKSVTNSIFQTGLFGNLWMILAFVISFGFLVLGIYGPGVAHWLEFEPFQAIGWAVVFIASGIHVVFVELMKLVIRVSQ